MRLSIPSILLVALVSLPAAAQDAEFSYESIAKRFPDTQLSERSVTEAKMHGECLVGLKQLIFVKRDHFDPVAEWINYRTFSLLEQFPPCNVLAMMEVARDELIGDEETTP
jgi:hypothetical protein